MQLPVNEPMQDSYLARRSGCSMVRSRDGLLLTSRETGHRLGLNRTAALTWLLCDGTRRAPDVVATVEGSYPDRRREAAIETQSLLDELLAGDWIRRRAVTAERPVLRVSFRDFWESFDSGDNYLVWMLSFRYDVLVLDEASIPDLLFFQPGAEDARAGGVSERTLRVACESNGDRREAPARDLTLVWDGTDGEHQLGLPSWALRLDWRRKPDQPGQDELARVSPQRFGERFVAALERLTGQWSGASNTPNVVTAAPEAEAAPEHQRDRPRLTVGMATPLPERREPRPRLTVGMATYDDYDGVYFTVHALVLYHPELAADLEILIVDNHPEGPDATALRGLAGAVDGARYLPFTELRGTAVRDLVFRHARAPIVACLDPHVLIPAGALLRLVEYLEARPDCRDLLQGPLLYDDHRTLSTHFEPIWSEGMYGVWETDDRGRELESEPFEIPMQGLGLFACRRRAWPGFNPRFRGFGGEEGYLHEKFRQRGGRALCLPFLRWLHRFQRPRGFRYANIWEERIRNYLIGHHELDLATAGLESHFRAFLGDEVYERAEATTELEMTSPFWSFDAIYGFGLDGQDDRRRFESECEHAGPSRLLRWQAPLPDTIPEELRCAASHRRALEQAARLGFESILLVDGRQLPGARALAALESALAASQSSDWTLLMTDSDTPHPPWAVAYHRRIYRAICEDLPPEPEPMAAKLKARGGDFWSYLDSMQLHRAPAQQAATNP